MYNVLLCVVRRKGEELEEALGDIEIKWFPQLL